MACSPIRFYFDKYLFIKKLDKNYILRYDLTVQKQRARMQFEYSRVQNTRGGGNIGKLGEFVLNYYLINKRF